MHYKFTFTALFCNKSSFPIQMVRILRGLTPKLVCFIPYYLDLIYTTSNPKPQYKDRDSKSTSHYNFIDIKFRSAASTYDSTFTLQSQSM